MAPSKQTAQEGIGEVDGAVSGGREDSVRRLATRFLTSSRVFRLELQAFDSSCCGRGGFAGISVVLRELSLVSTVKRTNPPMLSSCAPRMARDMCCHHLPAESCGGSQDSGLLRTDRAFYQFCVEEWRSRSVVSQSVGSPGADGGRVPSRRSWRRPRPSTSVDWSVGSRTEGRQKQWMAVQPRLALTFGAAPWQWKLPAAWWKQVLLRGAVLSLPLSLFDACRIMSHAAKARRIACSQTTVKSGRLQLTRWATETI